jgi:hypothetical protein
MEGCGGYEQSSMQKQLAGPWTPANLKLNQTKLTIESNL